LYEIKQDSSSIHKQKDVTLSTAFDKKNMTKPNKETPVLKGIDAINFINEMKEADMNKALRPEKERTFNHFATMAAIANFR
jgi:hypothetical protein